VFIQQILAACGQDGDGMTDGELLTRFLGRRDKVALTALVRRHAPLVWGVCCRILQNRHDAEDAFQATFLVLVRKAASVAPREMVANWLYGVAHRSAVRLRATMAKQNRREKQVEKVPEPGTVEARGNDLIPLLDQELNGLPEQFRALIVLCDLEGKTRKDVAKQLGIPEGTVASRLARARVKLSKALARHGLAITVGTLGAVLAQSAAPAAVPASVLTQTIRATSLLATGHQLGSGLISSTIVAHTEGVLKAMFVTKLKSLLALGLTIGAALVAVAGVGVSGGSLSGPLAAHPGNPSEEKPTPEEPKKPDSAAPASATKVDEPAWKKDFTKAYALADDEVLKRVAPPFPAARVEYYKNWMPGQTGNNLGLIVRWDGRTAEGWSICTRGFGLQALMNIGLGIPPHEVEGDQDLLRTVVEGDVIVRTGTPPEKFLAPLEKLVREATGKTLKITAREVEREVVVVRGTFVSKPFSDLEKNSVAVFARSPLLPMPKPQTTPPSDPAPPKGVPMPQCTGSGTLPEFLRNLGAFVNRRMINEVEKVPTTKLSWYEYFRNPATAAEQDQDRDPTTVLGNVADQTGLKFTTETRKVRVLFVEAK
jgi:RNA polymerase sigma factor (sigma-70 family)